MARFEADIAPAITELKELHLRLVQHAEAALAPRGGGLAIKSGLDNIGAQAAQRTVISIVPKDRRVEMGWYKFRMWEKKSEQVLELLDPEFEKVKYHEIFIAGEALSGDAEDLTLLMMHQVAHQAAGVGSVYSYHNEWMKHWMERLFSIPQDAWKREQVLGWVTVDKEKLTDEARQVIKKFADSIDMSNIDLRRDMTAKPQTTGKMYLWVCGCRRPKVRTGGVLRATCDLCGEHFKFQDAAKVDTAWLLKVPPEYRA